MFMYMRMHMCTYMYRYTETYVYMYVCAYANVYAYAYAYVLVCICLFILCLLYQFDAAEDLTSVVFGRRRLIKKTIQKITNTDCTLGALHERLLTLRARRINASRIFSQAANNKRNAREAHNVA